MEPYQPSDSNNSTAVRKVTPADLRRLRNEWSMACDSKLLGVLESSAQNVTSQTCQMTSEMDSVINDTKVASIKLANITNDFLMLSNAQFLENRVYEDESLTGQLQIGPSEPSVSKEQLQAENVTKMTEALRLSLSVIDNAFDKIEMNDSDDSEDDSSRLNIKAVLKYKDPYISRRLPYTIGTNLFYEDESVGLREELTDDEDLVLSPSKESDFDSEAERVGDAAFAGPSDRSKVGVIPNHVDQYDIKSVSSSIVSEDVVLRKNHSKDIFADEPKDLFENDDNEDLFGNGDESDKIIDTAEPKLDIKPDFHTELTAKLKNHSNITEIGHTSVKIDKNERIVRKSEADVVADPPASSVVKAFPDSDSEEDSLFSKKTSLFTAKKNLFDDEESSQDDDLFASLGKRNSKSDRNTSSLFFDDDLSSPSKPQPKSIASIVRPEKKISLFSSDLDTDSSDSDSGLKSVSAQPSGNNTLSMPNTKKQVVDPNHKPEPIAKPARSPKLNPIKADSVEKDLFDDSSDEDLFAGKKPQPKPKASSSATKKNVPNAGVSLFGSAGNSITSALKARQEKMSKLTASSDTDNWSDSQSNVSVPSSSSKVDSVNATSVGKSETTINNSESNSTRRGSSASTLSRDSTSKPQGKSNVQSAKALLFDDEDSDEDLFASSKKTSKLSDSKQSAKPVKTDKKHLDDLFNDDFLQPKAGEKTSINLFDDDMSESLKPGTKSSKPDRKRESPKDASPLSADEKSERKVIRNDSPLVSPVKPPSNAQTRKKTSIFDDSDSDSTDLFADLDKPKVVSKKPAVKPDHKPFPKASVSDLFADVNATHKSHENVSTTETDIFAGAKSTHKLDIKPVSKVESTDLFADLETTNEVSEGFAIKADSSSVSKNKSASALSSDHKTFTRETKTSDDSSSLKSERSIESSSSSLHNGSKHTSVAKKDFRQELIKKLENSSLESSLDKQGKKKPVGGVSLFGGIDPFGVKSAADKKLPVDIKTAGKPVAVANTNGASVSTESTDVLPSLSKTRAKIHVKRRPSTRRGRQTALRNSGLNFLDEFSDSSSKAGSVPGNELIVNGNQDYANESPISSGGTSPEHSLSNHVGSGFDEGRPSTRAMLNSLKSPSTEEDDFFDVIQQPADLAKTILTNRQGSSSPKSRQSNVTAKVSGKELLVGDLFGDKDDSASAAVESKRSARKYVNDDLFTDNFKGTSKHETKTHQSTMGKTDLFNAVSNAVQSKQPIDNLFSDDDTKDSPAKHDKKLELSDDENDLFSGKQNSVKKSKLDEVFVNDSDDLFGAKRRGSAEKSVVKPSLKADLDLFGDTTEGIFSGSKAKPKAASIKKVLLFGDDSDSDDLFSDKNKMAAVKKASLSSSESKRALVKKTQKENVSKAITSSVFDDPLNALK